MRSLHIRDRSTEQHMALAGRLAQRAEGFDSKFHDTSASIRSLLQRYILVVRLTYCYVVCYYAIAHSSK